MPKGIPNKKEADIPQSSPNLGEIAAKSEVSDHVPRETRTRLDSREEAERIRDRVGMGD